MDPGKKYQPLAKDRYNAVEFEPVTTTALRMEVQLPKEKFSDIHEWIVQ
jgi:hypothetical protein